jgi:hypothetical protein
MNQSLKAIIIDIDGTLANCAHRREFVTLSDTRKKKDWKSFEENCHLDPVNSWCVSIIDKFRSSHMILLVSGRSVEREQVTRDWLSKHGIFFNYLWMRPAKDNRDDRIIKKEIYDAHIKEKYNVEFVIDDRQRVVDMWREQGLVVLQCDKGDF